MARPTKTYTQEQIDEVMALHASGMGQRAIAAQTGIGLRKVQELVQAAPKPMGQYEQTVEEVFALATREQGIKDYEFRDILHRTYGTTWNGITGAYEAAYDDNVMTRVRRAVRTKAAEFDCNALFVPDWVNTKDATASQRALDEIALQVQGYADALLQELFVEVHGEEEPEALAKQMYSARRYVIKMALGAIGGEPVQVMHERCEAICGLLDGTPDDALPIMPKQPQGAVQLVPEPSDDSAFLDYVETPAFKSIPVGTAKAY